MKWSMFRCCFWTGVSPSTCISAITNIFLHIFWSKLSWWTRMSIRNYNVTNLVFWYWNMNISPTKMPWVDYVHHIHVYLYMKRHFPPSSSSITLFSLFFFKKLHVKGITTPYLCDDSSIFFNSTIAVDKLSKVLFNVTM